jgi:hypothetical protein
MNQVSGIIEKRQGVKHVGQDDTSNSGIEKAGIVEVSPGTTRLQGNVENGMDGRNKLGMTHVAQER